MSTKRRRFGRIRRLSSGRYQARYSLGDGQLRSAPDTFATLAEAEQFLAAVETEMLRGTWFDPDAGDIRLDVYAPRWLDERPVELQPRTREIYTRLLDQHLYPAFGTTPINRITSAAVRTWHASLRRQGVGQVTVAKAYRLLKAILNTAVEDELLPRNPCRLKGAGVERSAERKPPSLAEVELIAAAIEPRYRLLVLLGAWSGLRWGELAALTRQRIDRLHGVLHVVEAMVQADGGHRHIGPPKSAAGRRTVAIPPHPGRRSRRTWQRSWHRNRPRCCSPRRMALRWTARTSTPGGGARSRTPECRRTTSTTCGISPRRWPR